MVAKARWQTGQKASSAINIKGSICILSFFFRVENLTKIVLRFGNNIA